MPGQGGNSTLAITTELFEQACEHYARTGKKSDSAQLIGTRWTTLQYQINQRKDWQDRWYECEIAYREMLQEEAQRRAVEGVEQPMVSMGEVVTHQTVYSDSLLKMMLQAKHPDFQNKTVVEHHQKSPPLDMAIMTQDERDRVRMLLGEIRGIIMAANQRMLGPGEDHDMVDLPLIEGDH